MTPTTHMTPRTDLDSVYLASYKGTQPGVHGLVNRGIRLCDASAYSHTELCVGNPFEEVSLCYSSSGVDSGVRRKFMRLNPLKWDVLYLPWAWASSIDGFYELTAGDGYDYLGTGRFAVPWLLREHPSWWFCSEWALAALGMPEPWRFSPAGAHALCLSHSAVPLLLDVPNV